jgi:hypothetical protein
VHLSSICRSLVAGLSGIVFGLACEQRSSPPGEATATAEPSHRFEPAPPRFEPPTPAPIPPPIVPTIVLPGCKPPYWVDDRGIKHVKPECLGIPGK